MSKARRDSSLYSYCIRLLLYVKDDTELPALGNSNYCKEPWTIFSAAKTSIKHFISPNNTMQHSTFTSPDPHSNNTLQVKHGNKIPQSPDRQQTQCFSSTGEMSLKWEKLDCTGNVIFLLCI